MADIYNGLDNMADKQNIKRYHSELMLTDGLREYHVFSSPVIPKEDETLQTFSGKKDAIELVERCLTHTADEAPLKDFLKPGRSTGRQIFSKRELTEVVAEKLSAMTVLAVPKQKLPETGGSTPDEPVAEDPFAGIPLLFFSRKDHIRFRFVERDSGKPIRNITARIDAPNGRHMTKFSDRSGEIDIQDTGEGNCILSSGIQGKFGPTINNTLSVNAAGTVTMDGTKPLPVKSETWKSADGKEKRYYIADVSEHKVADGETLTSIAEANGLTFSDLAYFNWETYDRKKAIACMKRDTGCMKTTKDGTDCSFSSTDSPGTIFIPKPIETSEYESGKTHILSLSPVGFSMFHETFEVIVVNDDGSPGEEIPCEIKYPDGSIEVIKTDKNGKITHNGINATRIKVRLVDYDSSEITKG